MLGGRRGNDGGEEGKEVKVRPAAELPLPIADISYGPKLDSLVVARNRAVDSLISAVGK